jgi:hypothetical protein
MLQPCAALAEGRCGHWGAYTITVKDAIVTDFYRRSARSAEKLAL